MGVDYGGAFASGIQGFIQGSEARQSRDQRQQQMTQQAEMFKMQQQSHEMSQDLNDQKLEQLTMQNKTMANQMSKQNLFMAFDRGTLTDLNQALSSDDNMQKLFPGLQNVQEIPADRPQLKRQAEGMTHPVLTTSVENGKIVERVADLDALKMRTGYSSYNAKRTLETKQAENLNVEQDIMDAALATKDTAKVMEALELTQPELFLKAMSKGSDRRDSLKQYTEAFMRAYPNATIEQFQSAMSKFVQKSVEGTKSVHEDSDINEVMSGMDMGTALLEGKKTIDPKNRIKAELELISSDMYKVHKKKKEEFDGAVLNVKAFGRFNDKFQAAVKDGTYKSGYFDTFNKWMSQRVPGDMRNFSGMTDEDIMKTVGLEGTLGMEVARYLKEMSGTAASENEAARTLEYIIGSAGMQEDIRAKRIQEFTTNLTKRASDTGRSLVKAGFVGDTYDKYKSLQPNTGPGLTRAQKIEAIKNAQKGK